MIPRAVMIGLAYVLLYSDVQHVFHAWGGWANPYAWLAFLCPQPWIWRSCTYKDVRRRFRHLSTEAFRAHS